MPERLPRAGERVGFVDDAYNERYGTVTSEPRDFFGQVIIDVKPEGEWDPDELGTDGTLSLTLEECFEVDAEGDLDESFEAPTSSDSGRADG